MEYQYYDINFNRLQHDSVTHTEFELIKKDYQWFLYKMEDELDNNMAKLPKSNKMNWKMFFLLLASSITLILIGVYVRINENVNPLLKAGGALLGILTVFSPARMLMGKWDTTTHFKIRINEMTTYYNFHYPYIMESSSYNIYLKRITELS